MTSKDSAQEIPLYRAGTVVSSFLGSFGRALRETRLTAAVGYVISLSPSTFVEVFDLKGHVVSVSLETNDDGDRSDILIQTTSGAAVVEAKIDATDPMDQAFKYNARWRVLVTNHRPTLKQLKLRNIKYISWREIAVVLAGLSKSPRKPLSFCSTELLRHLEEHRMIGKRDSVEIYAREINEPITVNLFLKGHLYGCDYKKDSRLPEALYFAPHFGNWIAGVFPGVEAGISYLARIEAIEVVEEWRQLLAVVQERKGKPWLTSHKVFLDGIHKRWEWGKEVRNFLFLGKPRLAFNPPIKKNFLQAGSGFLSKNYFTFDQLYQAWSHHRIYGGKD
ncbi:MAG: hypothetical protein Q8P51_19045 [Ignavibacteria bacterium]|nr:hypothetical protein [Ignavibacteria bacterium]